ncbi:hypothetical protein F5Y15DRAFT_417614 [Xylariaceae sp. FL0016]|nr:hypothetical protein F5Y15DRAFT_417614 [Xylariaceae sp. FL0016]
MTRIYDSQYVCNTCRRPGPQGYLYRCTQDREYLIEEAVRAGRPVSFDLVGLKFATQISLGPRCAERRSDKLNFFEEISVDDLVTYSPSQISTILRQRENLLEVARLESRKTREGCVSFPPGFSPGYLSRVADILSATRSPGETRPWIPEQQEECQAKYCHRCRPSCKDRAFLSLNGVLSGEIPPTAASSFGFGRLGTRPIYDANVVKNIGLRAVPWPRARSHSLPSSPSSDESFLSISDIVDAHNIDEANNQSDSLPSLYAINASSVDSLLSGSSSENEIPEGLRTPGSPPPTPKAWKGRRLRRGGMTSFETHPHVCNGRSPSSLKANPGLLDQVKSSIEGVVSNRRDALEIDQYDRCHSLVAEEKVALLKASLTPLPSPSSEEEVSLREHASQMMVEEAQEGVFHEEPLDVGTGMAVLEESVELGVPDVISQV